MSQNSYEIKGNIISVPVNKNNSEQFNKGYDLIDWKNKGKEGDPCLASKQNMQTTQANQVQAQGQDKSDSEQ